MPKPTDSIAQTGRKKREIKLSPREVRSLYFLKEPLVEEMVEAAVMLDETERKLAIRLIKGLIDHRRSQLS